MNHFSHMKTYPDASFRDVVRPNADTLYSTLWFDVGKEPLILTLPDTAGRYHVVPIMDMWTEVFATLGTRTTGNDGGRSDERRVGKERVRTCSVRWAPSHRKTKNT